MRATRQERHWLLQVLSYKQKFGYKIGVRKAVGNEFPGSHIFLPDEAFEAAKKSSHFHQSMLESKETGDYYLYTRNGG